jgi:hypothetical protein
MSELIQGISEIIETYKNPYRYKLTEDQRRLCLGMAGAIKEASIYEASRDITLYINEQKKIFETIPADDLYLPVDARPPATHCVVYMPNSERGFFMRRDAAGVFSVTDPKTGLYKTQHPSVSVVMIGKNIVPKYCGFYLSSDKEEENKIHIPLEEVDNFDVKTISINSLLTIGLFFSLINQPRFVVQEPNGSRPARRQMQRSHGIPIESWHTIRWNLNKPRVQAGESTGTGRHMPLHYTRGHWRKAQEHWEGVVQRVDGDYYKWIEGYWSGHPAYGIKKAVYAPRIGEKNYETLPTV